MQTEHETQMAKLHVEAVVIRRSRWKALGLPYRPYRECVMDCMKAGVDETHPTS